MFSFWSRVLDSKQKFNIWILFYLVRIIIDWNGKRKTRIHCCWWHYKRRLNEFIWLILQQRRTSTQWSLTVQIMNLLSPALFLSIRLSYNLLKLKSMPQTAVGGPPMKKEDFHSETSIRNFYAKKVKLTKYNRTFLSLPLSLFPQRTQSNRRLYEHGIPGMSFIRHCQDSNSQPVLWATVTDFRIHILSQCLSATHIHYILVLPRNIGYAILLVFILYSLSVSGSWDLLLKLLVSKPLGSLTKRNLVGFEIWYVCLYGTERKIYRELRKG